MWAFSWCQHHRENAFVAFFTTHKEKKLRSIVQQNPTEKRQRTKRARMCVCVWECGRIRKIEWCVLSWESIHLSMFSSFLFYLTIPSFQGFGVVAILCPRNMHEYYKVRKISFLEWKRRLMVSISDISYRWVLFNRKKKYQVKFFWITKFQTKWAD